MKVTQRLITFALFATFGGAAFAQEATPDTWLNGAVASKSRDQVKAELAQARKDGTINAVSVNYNFAAATNATKSRDQVKAELMAARESGEYDVLNNEVHAFGITPRSTAYAKRGQ